MLIWENILLAFHGLRANKMRSLLTMLGIIIGIASVIAIMTLGNSLSQSVTDSMSSMGANNITVGLQQKSSSTETTSSGMTFVFGPRMTKMQEEDYVSGKAQKGSKYAYVNAEGVNASNLENLKLTLLAGRLLSQRDQDEARRVVLVSDLVVKNMFDKDVMSAIGQTIDVLFQNRYDTYTIVGVYQYEESSMGFSSASEEDTETMMYLPLQAARDQNHNTSGYSQFTI